MEQLNLDLTALQTALTAVIADVAALPTSMQPNTTDPNDAVVAAFISSLTSDGWTVTAPQVEPEIPAVT